LFNEYFVFLENYGMHTSRFVPNVTTPELNVNAPDPERDKTQSNTPNTAIVSIITTAMKKRLQWSTGGRGLSTTDETSIS